MNAEAIAKTIQIIIAPVVMITACAILLGGLHGRYASISSRLRTMAYERLELLHDHSRPSEFTTERLQQIDAQLPELLRHQKGVHDALQLVYYAIVVFIVDMFLIAFVAVTRLAWLATGSLLIFLVAMVLLLLATTLAAIDFRTAHSVIQYEVRKNCGLMRKEGAAKRLL